MEPTTSVRPLRKINWKWVGVGYCLFVVYHLLPSYVLLGFARFGMLGEAGKGIWLFIGFAVIAFYIGYRSRGITILEPAISSVLYVVTLTLLFEKFWGRSFSMRSAGVIYVWIVGAGVIAFVSAWVGELWQSRKERARSST
jgi:hypothetical protein